MRMKKSYLALAFTILITTVSCSKKNDVKDCEKNNYGIATINFASGNVKHSVIITIIPAAFIRDKQINIGKTSDTLHLKPGSYLLNISSLNNNGQALDQKNQSIAILECSEEQISVSF
jgi:hypothetical protein